MQLSNYTCADEEAVNRIALASFQQYQHHYQDWEVFSRRIGNMSSLAGVAEIIVARVGEEIAGAVAYVGPGKPRANFFSPEWPLIRMLVVDPRFRGQGIGRALTEECIRRAVREGAELIALHTSPIMEVALAMYLRMGFHLVSDAPPIHGIPYGIYIKKLRTG